MLCEKELVMPLAFFVPFPPVSLGLTRFLGPEKLEV